jgi:ABC-type dipeptide/oligopeptide/nickel transport system permease component
MDKLEFILRRLATSILVLVGVSIITFSLARVIPSNAAALYIGPRARPADIERVTKELGLDRPLPVQYAVYMRDMLRGDWGTSIGTKRPVLQEIGDRLPATLELLLAAMLLATTIGIPLGVLSARWQGRPLDTSVRVISILGVSLPAFWLGLLLQILFFRNLEWLPLAGQYSTELRFSSPIEPVTGFLLLDAALGQNWIGLKDAALHLILPAVTLAAYPLGLIARMTRGTMLEVLEQDYIRTARAYGIRERVDYLRLRLTQRHWSHPDRRWLNDGLCPDRGFFRRSHFQLAGIGSVYRALPAQRRLSGHHGHHPVRRSRLCDAQPAG